MDRGSVVGRRTSHVVVVVTGDEEDGGGGGPCDVGDQGSELRSRGGSRRRCNRSRYPLLGAEMIKIVITVENIYNDV